jgi:uncharacterized membrane protein
MINATSTANPSSFADARIENYLARLESALRGMSNNLSEEEKQDILCEIRAHVVDSVAAARLRNEVQPSEVREAGDAALSRVLKLLGTPEELAQRYNTERLLARAGSSFSPWLLLRTTWRWAKLGMKGTVAFFVALFGYSCAFALTVAVILKPVMPSRVGVWWGRGDLNVGMVDHPEQMHELLGQWFVPVMVVLAFALAVGTTHALRWLIRKRTVSMLY